jgi:Flp pilus assembly protein CpaB
MNMPHSNMPPAQTAPTPKAAKAKKGPKSSRSYAIAAVALSVIAAAVVMLGTGDSAQTFVYKAKAPIAARALVSAEMFEAIAVSDTEVVDGAFTAPSVEELAEVVSFDGLVTLYPMARGQMLVKNQITQAQTDAPLKPDERLISVKAVPASAVAGTLRVGDYVDVFAVGTSDLKVANLILADVEIVGISLPSEQLNSIAQQQSTDLEADRDTLLPVNPIPGVYTIRVPSTVIARLAVLDANETLVLAYRTPDSETTINEPADLILALCGPTSTFADAEILLPVDPAADPTADPTADQNGWPAEMPAPCVMALNEMQRAIAESAQAMADASLAGSGSTVQGSAG